MLSKGLSIPRRPPWSKLMTADEIDRSEGLAFLEWRRNLAKLEEESKSKITPFEKNLDIWRQLWRVVEYSSVLLIVLYFYYIFFYYFNSSFFIFLFLLNYFPFFFSLSFYKRFLMLVTHFPFVVLILKTTSKMQMWEKK